ncbi:DUF3566 domain-containing protein [Paenarthrobacter sp. Z7-10]|uniref:DUF3566 domain-containing protein n=1 Tax=Paenarthrobacter sp. Z7-10 TaxID=2787635 RepID=UPI0022A9B35F|nr:DUF3566 domain-containing protein [Paenarthrobacter sp. Z7-10]MCZ2404716.1 DUF3566 domain-containing protein [Paenarthrobacter sp. Z7-10]
MSSVNPVPGRGPVRAGPTQPRRARLLVSKASPWKILQTAFLLSIALGVLTVAGYVALWMIFAATGFFDQLSAFLTSVVGTSLGSPVDLRHALPLNRVAAFATIVALVNVVLISVSATIGVLVYNVSAILVGGLEVTLTDG